MKQNSTIFIEKNGKSLFDPTPNLHHILREACNTSSFDITSYIKNTTRGANYEKGSNIIYPILEFEAWYVLWTPFEIASNDKIWSFDDHICRLNELSKLDVNVIVILLKKNLYTSIHSGTRTYLMEEPLNTTSCLRKLCQKRFTIQEENGKMFKYPTVSFSLSFSLPEESDCGSDSSQSDSDSNNVVTVLQKVEHEVDSIQQRVKYLAESNYKIGIDYLRCNLN